MWGIKGCGDGRGKVRDGGGLGREGKDGSTRTSDLRVAGFAESCNDDVPLQNAACNNGEDVCPQLLQCHKPTVSMLGRREGERQREGKEKTMEDASSHHSKSHTPSSLIHHTLLPSYITHSSPHNTSHHALPSPHITSQSCPHHTSHHTFSSPHITHTSPHSPHHTSQHTLFPSHTSHHIHVQVLPPYT